MYQKFIGCNRTHEIRKRKQDKCVEENENSKMSTKKFGIDCIILLEVEIRLIIVLKPISRTKLNRGHKIEQQDYKCVVWTKKQLRELKTVSKQKRVHYTTKQHNNKPELPLNSISKTS